MAPDPLHGDWHLRWLGNGGLGLVVVLVRRQWPRDVVVAIDESYAVYDDAGCLCWDGLLHFPGNFDCYEHVLI